MTEREIDRRESSYESDKHLVIEILKAIADVWWEATQPYSIPGKFANSRDVLIKIDQGKPMVGN